MIHKGFVLLRTGKKSALLLGQVIVLLFCVGFMFYFTFLNLFPDKYTTTKFQSANALLLDKKMMYRNHVIPRYRADFLISYNVNNVQYNRWVSANGLDQSYHLNKNRQEHLLGKFSIGKTYPCYYNPKNPEIALLLFRYDWSPFLYVIFLLILSCVMFYYVLDNIIRE